MSEALVVRENSVVKDVPTTPKMTNMQLFIALAGLCLAELIVVLDNTIVNVAIPTFSRELSATTTQLEWIVDGYTLTFASLLLPAGYLSDRMGRRTILIIGLIGFAIVSVLTTLSTTLPQLLVARVGLGVCAAAIFPATLSSVTTMFSGSRFKGVAIGLWAATAGVGIALGPVLGGVLLEHYSWTSIFWINLPIAFAAVLLIWLFVTSARLKHLGRFDFCGAVLSIVAVGSLVWAIIEGPHWGWDSKRILLAFALAAIGFVCLTFWELHHENPLIDVRLFRSSTFSTGSFSICTAFFCLFGFVFVITVFFQAVRGYSALECGVAILPFAIVMAGLSPVATIISHKIGPAWVISGGLVVLAAGYLVVTSVSADASYWGVIVPSMALQAAGLSMVQGPATRAIMDVASDEHAGAASAINDTTREVGGALGVAVFGSVVATHFSAELYSNILKLDLPTAVRESAQGSIMAANSIAEHLPTPARQILEQAAADSFMYSLHRVGYIALWVALFGALVALIFLPRKPTSTT